MPPDDYVYKILQDDEGVLSEEDLLKQLDVIEDIYLQEIIDKEAEEHRSAGQRWGASGHARVGDSAFSKFMKSHREDFQSLFVRGFLSGDKKEYTFLKVANISLSPGAISALAGDFYARVGHPITEETDGASQVDRELRFSSNFMSLLEADQEEIQKIIDVITAEKKIVRDAIDSHQSPSKALAKANTRDAKFALASLKFCSCRYISLALDNRDHFRPYNRDAYEAGHQLALQQAKLAHDETSPGIKEGRLHKAILMELYAQHYMGDAFAAGHMRVPRVELVDSCRIKKLGALLVKKMHDEDNEHGVEVTSEANEDGWTAFGDGHMEEKNNETNKSYLILALVAGLEDVWLAYDGKNVIDDYKKYWPAPKGRDVQTHKPLFWVNRDHPMSAIKRTKDVTVYRREKVADIECDEGKANWWPWTSSTLFQKPKLSSGKSAGSNLAANDKKEEGVASGARNT